MPGTTLLYIASDAFEIYQNETQAVLDETTGLLTVESVESLYSLFFTIGGVRGLFKYGKNWKLIGMFSKNLNSLPMHKSGHRV